MTLLTEPFPHTPSFTARKVFELEYRTLVEDPDGPKTPHEDGGYVPALKIGTRLFHVLAVTEQGARLVWWHRFGPHNFRCSSNQLLTCKPLCAIDAEITLDNK